MGIFARFALTIGAAALSAGCRGSQPPISVPRAMPQSHATTRGGSWMLPGPSSGALIYAVGGCKGTCVVSYPDLKLIGTVPTDGAAICSDSEGNVFIPKDGEVTEYAHGGTSPVAVLNLPGYSARGCGVDPATNNLAVVFSASDADVAIFANEQGSPTLYQSHIGSEYCGYDDSGNLFVDGNNGQNYALSELPRGGTEFTTLSISDLVGGPGQIQWDGSYITWEGRGNPVVTISRLAISGSTATIVGTTRLGSIRHRGSQSWLYGDKIIVPYFDRGSRFNIIGVWNYPKGGKVRQTIRKFDSYAKRTISFQGVTLSVQP